MITYQSEGIPMPRIKKRPTTAWIRRVAASHGRKVGEIGYLFVNDEKILEVNRQYLGHDYFTDIITFDYCEGDNLSGDLFISIDSVRENSIEYGTDFKDELNRVIIHGLLHLIGYDDHTVEETAVMRMKENYYLSLRESL